VDVGDINRCSRHSGKSSELQVQNDRRWRWRCARRDASRQSVRAHDRLGRAVVTRGEQFERAATVRFGTAAGHWPRQYAMPWLGEAKGIRFVEAELSRPLRCLAVRRPFEPALDGPLHALTKSFIHAQQALAAVLADNLVTGLHGTILAARVRLRLTDSFAVRGHRARRDAGREGRIRATRLNPITESGKAAAHKEDERAWGGEGAERARHEHGPWCHLL